MDTCEQIENEYSVGETIRRIRREKRMTQKTLSKLVGCADSAIRKYESGTVVPKTAMLKRIAKALDVSIADLIDPEIRHETEITAYETLLSKIYEKCGNNRGHASIRLVTEAILDLT